MWADDVLLVFGDWDAGALDIEARGTCDLRCGELLQLRDDQAVVGVEPGGRLDVHLVVHLSDDLSCERGRVRVRVCPDRRLQVHSPTGHPITFIPARQRDRLPERIPA